MGGYTALTAGRLAALPALQTAAAASPGYYISPTGTFNHHHYHHRL